MSQLNKILLEGLKEIVILTIMVCADEYKFDGNEALSKICMNDVMRKMSSMDSMDSMDPIESSMLSAKLSSSLGEKVREEVRKEKKETKKSVKKEEKSEIPMPYNGEHNEECCNGLKYNFGLYTQCKVKSKNGEKYCKMCENQASKHGHGKPTYGTIQDRLEAGIMDFVDPSGKKPEMYMKVLKKQNITIDEAVDEAKKQKITINSIHFEEESEVVSEKVVEKSKGRPKKGKKLLEIGNEEGEEDLLNTLLVAAKEKVVPEAEKKKKEAEQKKKEEEKEAKEAEKKKKEAERKQKEEEKEAKEAERKKKEQEKEAERKKKEQEKEAEQKKKEQEKKKKEPEEEEASGEVSKVKRFTYTDGLVYLKSATGIVYNSDHDEVGKWDKLTKTIEFNVEKDDRELSEDEYEEEEEEELEDLKNDEEEEEEEEADE
jgi:aspartate beta-hydroxylase